MKKLMLTVIAAVFVLALTGSATILAAEVKIGVMDLNTIITESDAGKAANSELAALVEVKQALVDEKGLAIEALNTELEEKADSLAADEKQAKEAELDKLIREYEQTAAQAENEIQARAQELRGQILAEIGEVLRILGQQENYTMIVDVSTVHYYSQVIDVTSEVIRTYNELRSK